MTAMDVPSLIAALQKATSADQSLPFTGAVVGSSDLDALLRVYFPAGTITVLGATVKPSPDGNSALVSGKVTYGAAACVTGLVLTPTAKDVSLVLTLTPPAGWTLPQLFPSVLDPTLSGLTFAGGGLVICSAPYQEPSQHLTLARGMTLVATLDLVKSYPLLTTVLGTVPVAVHGVVTDPNLPQMVLVTDPRPARLGTVPLAAVTMTFTLGNIADAGQPPVSLATAMMQAAIALSDSIGGAVTAALPAAGSLLGLDVAFSNVNLGDLSLLKPFLGAVDPIAALPTEISDPLTRAGSAFQLSSLGLRFDTAAMRFLAVDIVVTVDLKGFTPFPVLPSLKIDDLVLALGVDLLVSPMATTFAATADIDVTSTCRVALGVQTEPNGEYLIYLRQNADGSLKLSDLVTAFLPGLPLPELDVTDLAITLAPRDGVYMFAAVVDGSWTVLHDIGIALATVEVSAFYVHDPTPSLSGSIAGVLQLELGSSAQALPADDPGVDPPPPVIDLMLTATQPASGNGWLLMGGTGPDQVVPVGDLMAALAHKFGVPAIAPAAISDLTIQNLSVQFDTVTRHFAFACEVNVDIEGEPVAVLVTVSVTSNGIGYDLAFGGTILVGALEFGLYFDEAGTSTSLVAVYARQPGDPEQMALRDLVAAVSPTAAAAVPADIDIQLDGVKLVFIQQDTGTEFAFSLDLSLSFGLSDLPLVGSALPNTSVSIQHLQLLYSRTALTATQAADINGRLSGTVIPFPANGLAPGVAVTANLLVGGETKAIAFGVPSSGSPAGLAATAAPASQPTGHWFDVNKSFGPVSIGRIGLRYQDSALLALIDATLSLGALTVGLDGLGLGSPLSTFAPRAHLDGLSVSFVDGPVSVDGAFLAVTPPPGVTDEYIGALTVAIEPYLITGVGAYANVGGSPSLFVFAEVDGEFGGPPAFFVTGLMGGIGYNWALSPPPADQVFQFPFVAGIGKPSFFGGTNPSPIQVLDALSGQGGRTAWVTPSAGTTWLAAGIQFRSFELVLGRALLVAEFGREFELGLLGLATVALPQGATTDAYAYAELQLEVVVKPDDGVFSAVASLTPNSFVITRACQLTGGFAFSLWFGANPHAGDFVLTLGGYHPAFTPPAWYPSVPRLGFHWAVDDDIVIKGGSYFAVTPTAAMAGGSLEVLFESGDLRAWLTAYANIMIRWRPFYLTADIGISVGVSYRLNLLFCSVTLSVELGATLSLWGPPTGGVVHVDWYIISFSIGFGASPASPADLILDWAGFQALLPSAGNPAPPAVAGALAALDTQPAVVNLSISAGLRTTDKATGHWIVRADELVLTATSAIPMTSVFFGRSVTLPDQAPATIDIRPMGASNLTSACTIAVSGVDLTKWPTPTVQSSALPEALWGAPISGAPAPTANLVDHLPTSVVFAPPAATAGSMVGPVDPSQLVTPLGQGYLPLRPGSQADPIAEPVADAGTIQLIAADVASAAAVQAQQALVTVLAGYAAAPPTTTPLTRLGQQTGAVFAQPPMRTA